MLEKGEKNSDSINTSKEEEKKESTILKKEIEDV